MLNPSRESLSRAGREAWDRSSPFRAEADAALASFRAVRADLERQVRQGNLTVKVARERAAESAARMRASLLQQSEGYSSTPRAFLDRLIEATDARRKARESLSLEGLQRETNRLLRLNLLEQQLQSRAGEFEGKAFHRPVTGGSPAPTLDGLLGFHRQAREAGDEVAEEWSRRQLEAFRTRTFSDDDVRKIDLACDQPERVNARLVDVYVEALKSWTPDEKETFIAEALASGDANGCVAAFVLARQDPDGARSRWVRKVLAGLPGFPDAALATLRTREAEARGSEADAARAQADFAIARAEAEVGLDGLEPPTAAELDRAARVQARPVANPGEAIGLALDRRGLMNGDEDREAVAVSEIE